MIKQNKDDTYLVECDNCNTVLTSCAPSFNMALDVVYDSKWIIKQEKTYKIYCPKCYLKNKKSK